MQNQSLIPKNARYFFSRLKDSYIENGQTFITLYACLMIAVPERKECIWESLEKVALNQVNRKLQNAPNGIYTYQVPEEVFRELKRLSKHQQNELYSLTPLYQLTRISRLVPNGIQ